MAVGVVRSSHSTAYIYLRLETQSSYKCSASLHNSSITAGIPAVLQCKYALLHYSKTKKVVQ